MKRVLIFNATLIAWCGLAVQTALGAGAVGLSRDQLKGAIQQFNSGNLTQSSATLEKYFDTSNELDNADAFYLRARLAAASLDAAGIDQAVSQLEKSSTSSLKFAETLLLKADFLRNYAGDSGRLGYYHKIAEKWPGSEVAAKARLRLNDYVLHNQYEKAIKSNEQILKDFPLLPKTERDWALMQNGLYCYQLGKSQEASGIFRHLLDSNPDPQIASVSNLYLEAIKEPESPKGLIALYEKGERFRQGGTTRNLCWEVFRQFDALTQKPFYKNYCEDESVPAEDRADLMFKHIVVLWELGKHDDVIDRCDFILETFKPKGLTRLRCLYTEAYHHAHCGHFSMAAEIYKKILSENPDNASIVPETFHELAHCQEMAGEYPDAYATLDQFCRSYPYRCEVKEFEFRMKQLRAKFAKGGEGSAPGTRRAERPLLLKSDVITFTRNQIVKQTIMTGGLK